LDPGPSWYAVGTVLCVLILAFTSAVDAALSAISRHRLHQMQNDDEPRSRIVHRLLEDPYRFKSAVIFLNAGATIAATAFTLRMTHALPASMRVGALCGLLLIILILSEALPKALAARNPQRAAGFLARPMNFITTLLQPVLGMVNIMTRPLVSVIGGQQLPVPLVTEEELLLLVNVGEEEGLIEPGEREMIEGIFSFDDTVVREVMVPRVDIVAVEVSQSLDDALELAIKRGFSRLPVYEETIDRIVGILNVKDLLPMLRVGQRHATIAELMRPAHYVPETMKVSMLLKDLQQRKSRIAIVVDEYGGTAGVVTIEDVVEEIVGEIHDEYDLEEPSMELIGPGELITDARISLDDINSVTGLELSSEESDRIGGLVYEQLGRVPHEGDVVDLPNGVQITVLSVVGLGARLLRLTYPPDEREEPVGAAQQQRNGEDDT
jgi:putative hemolysin